jgi:two-component system phosphate regulon sensor histidine kinase PhoR
MGAPILLASVLLLSLLSFGFILYYFYRQRYWNGTQKDFLNNLMHEFRTPVSVMSIASKVLLAEGIEFQPTRLRQYAGIIKLQTEELEWKSRQVMDWALMEKKSVAWKRESVDLNEIISNAINFVQPLAEERRASIDFRPPYESINITADAGYLTQAIVNLLDNSLKYALEPQIELGIQMSNATCTLSVRDNGIGIDEKYHKHIFRKFYRIPTGNIHNVKGFGIGLNFVKKVVDAHKGRIEVNSVMGKGTEFTIHLPLT